MISLRYHIVSLVAVFLALAVGVVMGSTVLEGGTIRVLRATTQRVEESNRGYRDQIGRLEGELGQLRAFDDATFPELVAGHLTARPVVLVDTDRVEGATRDAVRRALETAGAEVQGRITLSSSRLALAERGDRNTLGALLGTAEGDPDRLRQSLVERLALRLAAPSRLPQDARARLDDVVTGLDQARFVSLDLQGEFARGTAPFPRAGTLFVVLGPAQPSGPLEPDQLLVPLADQLAQRSAAPVAAAEAAAPGAKEPSWVQALRADRDASRRVLSIDHADTVPGQVALVWALERRLQDPTWVGHFGVKDGNDGIVPRRSGT